MGFKIRIIAEAKASKTSSKLREASRKSLRGNWIWIGTKFAVGT
jgi:hypothetical protein